MRGAQARRAREEAIEAELERRRKVSSSKGQQQLGEERLMRLNHGY
jgi:hypothetical protein